MSHVVTAHAAKGGDPSTDNYVTHSFGFDASEDGTGRDTPLVADPLSAHEARTTSHAGNNPRPRNLIVFDPVQATHPENRSRFDSDVCHTLSAESAARAAIAAQRVRRLTPTECERLQGMPDSHTLIPYRGKPAADGPRYRAIGNGIAVPVLRWIAGRIAKVAP